MTEPPGLPELVLDAARDIGDMGSALDAELLVSTLIGSIYAAVLPDRGAAIDSFLTVFTEHVGHTEGVPARIVQAVLDAWAGRPAEPVPDAPDWVSALGTAAVTGAYAYGDRYGDQTSYVATFAYAGDDVEHAIVVLADHNLGIAKEIFVASPAAALLETLRGEVVSGADEMTWFAEIDPATMRTAALAYVHCTDAAEEVPGTFGEDRAITVARLGLLPVGTPAPDSAPAEDLIEDFLASPEADLAGLTERTGTERESLSYCLGLIVDFATGRGDALRWSPAGVETFLGTWVHERALLDADDAALLPDALRAWVAWAGRRLALPAAALGETLSAVRVERAEFLRVHHTGERQSPGARAMMAMLAEGVDLADVAAVEEWLKTYRDDAE